MLIAITGRSHVGKSTLANELASKNIRATILLKDREADETT